MLVADLLLEPAEPATPKLNALPSEPKVEALKERKPKRYVPERGLVRRIRSAQANDGLGELAARHMLDPETQAQLSAELIKAGAPPITPSAAEKAFSRIVNFEPLNVDALHPFVFLALDRDLRARALASVGSAFHAAGRSVRFLSNASDTRTNDALLEAGQKIGCGVTPFDGVPNCVEIMRTADLACLNLIETGFRAPLNRIATLRLNTLIQATGSEPVLVMRPEDVDLAVKLSSVGVKRVVLAYSEAPAQLGPVLSLLRDANLSIAEFLDLRGPAAKLRPAQASELASLLMNAKPQD